MRHDTRELQRRVLRRLAMELFPVLRLVAKVYEIGGNEHAVRRFRRQGENVFFSATTSEIGYPQVTIGDNVTLGQRGRIWAAESVTLGDDVMFGPEVFIMDGYHRYDVVGQTIRDSGPDEREPVIVEDDVWVGARSTILKGVRVGEGTVIGTGSLVRRSIPPYVVAAGVPCRPVGRRFDDEELREHLRRRGRDARAADRMVVRRSAELAEWNRNPLPGDALPSTQSQMASPLG